jgi:recombination protein RecA
MVRPIDASKFRKSLTKNIDGISVGFNDPKTWISTNNYLLNYILSGSFKRGVPLGKVTMFAGESGSGKSLVAANLMKEAQKQGIFVVGFDSENAHDEKWLHDCGVDTSDDKYLRIQVSMIDDVAKSISQFMADYKAQYKELAIEDRPKILFVIDSLGALLTPTDVDQFTKGDMKGDMGRKPKALNALVKNCVIQFSEWEVGLIATNHSYESQDMFSPDPKISGGAGFIYSSSQVVAFKKLNLKEDEDGNKTTTIQGIRTAVKVIKTRFTKPFETMQMKIPYNVGIDPFSGLIDYFEEKGVFTKDGNRLKWVSVDNEEVKLFRKEWNAIEGRKILLRVMEEFELLNFKNIENERKEAAKMIAEMEAITEEVMASLEEGVDEEITLKVTKGKKDKVKAETPDIDEDTLEMEGNG